MINIREFTEADVSALEDAMEIDQFHKGEWKVEHFWRDGKCPDNALGYVIEDNDGPTAFVQYTSSLRISCVWADGESTSRNARAVIHGLRDAVNKARQGGFSEVIIRTKHDKLSNFLTKVMKMECRGEEHVLYV